MLPIGRFEQARERIAGRVRRTPSIAALGTRGTRGDASSLVLKLECLQVTGAFKIRGALVAALALSEAELTAGLITASGGNHGLGVACAAQMLGTRARVVLPANSPAHKEAAIRAWGAEIRRAGDVWDDANEAALDEAGALGMTYVHPFADEGVVAGQGTIALEMLDDNPELDTLVVPIGGGGLIAGMANAAKLTRPDIRIVGVEPTGAPTLFESRRAGRPIELDRVTTAANTLAPKGTDRMNFEIIEACVDEIVLVTDDEMEGARRWLRSEMHVGAELSGAAATAVVLNGRSDILCGARVGAIVCGADTDGRDVPGAPSGTPARP